MSMTVRRAFTTNFRRLLVEKDYTMKGFADESGFDYSAIWAWVNGRRYPNLETAFRIAKTLQVSIDDLVKGAVDDRDA